MYLKAYLKSCKRGEFEWKPKVVIDKDVVTESVKLQDRIAEVYFEDDIFFAFIKNLKHSPFSIQASRKSRNTARKLAEKLILKDIEKSKILAICDLELLAK